MNKRRRLKKKALKVRKKRRSVSKQGEDEVKPSKGEASVHLAKEWDDLEEDIEDTMEYTFVQDENRVVDTDGEKEGTALHEGTEKEKEGIDKEKEGTDRHNEGTDKSKVSTSDGKEGTDEQDKDKASTPPTPTTISTPEPSTIIGDDDTIAQILLNMSEVKAVEKEKEKEVETKETQEKEKEKGVKIRETQERPRTTTTRSVLTLKKLPKINPKDKGKKVLVEEDESEEESEGEDAAIKKVEQLTMDEEIARKAQANWDAEDERIRKAEEEAAKATLVNEYDFIKARIEADRILTEEIQKEEREQFTIEERAKFLYDTIVAQRRFLAEQRSAAIKSKPPTKTQLRNQMMTYIKHVGNKKHNELKSKSFEEIKAMYEKLKRFDESFVAIRSEEHEKIDKRLNEEARNPKLKIVKTVSETVNKDDKLEESAKSEEKEQSTKKRKGSRIKMLARKKIRS
ncbi:hypothetical protein Tco_1191455 [Tanacetum coccineum]